MTSKKSKKIVVLATGGTIAGTANPAGTRASYTAAQLGVQALVDAVPNLEEALQGHQLVCEQVAQIDSKDMTHSVWQALAQRCAHWGALDDVGALVITHGTDTLEETAWFLQQVLDTPKPVVLTCAMRPATDPQPDGPGNLRDALRVASDAQARGVLAVCAGHVHTAHALQKVHPTRLDAFASVEGLLAGSVKWPHVQWARKPVSSPVHAHAHQALTSPTENWPWVAVLHSHAQADARAVRALVQAGVKGIVVAGTGNGTVHQNWLDALSEAQAQGVAVRLTTRCADSVMLNSPIDLPLAPSGLNAYKARISLMLDLMDQLA